MIPLQSFISYPVFGDNATKVKPDDVKYAAGFQQSDVLPAEWMNWAWNKNTQGITDLNRGSCSIEQELLAVLCDASITACEAQTNQLLCSIVAIINKCNAGSATKLATGRKINGSSFNGTADITTANWGTARNICISDSDGTNKGSAVSVDGSGNATLKLPATIKANLSGNATTATCASCNGSGTAFGSAATCTAGSGANNLPIVGSALGTTNGQFIATDANGKLKPSGYSASSFLGASACATDSAKLAGKAPDSLCVACAGANGSGTAFGTAATCAVKTLTAKGDAGYNSSCVACQNLLVTAGFMSFWNGAYSGTSSNLTYYCGGTFGSAAKCDSTSFLAAAGCAADSKLLTGKAPNALCVACAGKDGSGCAFGTAARCAATAFLGASACAADSAKLGGTAASSYITYASGNFGSAYWRRAPSLGIGYIYWNTLVKKCDLYKAICCAVNGNTAKIFAEGGTVGASYKGALGSYQATSIGTSDAGATLILNSNVGNFSITGTDTSNAGVSCGVLQITYRG